MHPLFKTLLAGKPVITDGAWGTELQKLGLLPGEHPDLWNLSHPDRVGEVASRYVEAGSTVILTNTFRSNRIALGTHPGGIDPAALNVAGVRISRKAAAGRARVFASVGPSGKMLMSEEVTEAELTGAFTEQCRALAGAGADALLIETMSDLEEARIAVRAAKTTGLPVVVSMVFDSGKAKDRTMMGLRSARRAPTRSAPTAGWG
jgi:5-methyltetrahydrofolate--homocysteine methyltransferase